MELKISNSYVRWAYSFVRWVVSHFTGQVNIIYSVKNFVLNL